MDEDQARYHEKKFTAHIAGLADRCRKDVRAAVRRAGLELERTTDRSVIEKNAEVGLLIGRAIRDAVLDARVFERWVIGRPSANAGSDRQPPAAVGIPPLPKATSTEDPEHDADETTCMRCRQPWRRCECRKDAG